MEGRLGSGGRRSLHLSLERRRCLAAPRRMLAAPLALGCWPPSVVLRPALVRRGGCQAQQLLLGDAVALGRRARVAVRANLGRRPVRPGASVDLRREEECSCPPDSRPATRAHVVRLARAVACTGSGMGRRGSGMPRWRRGGRGRWSRRGRTIWRRGRASEVLVLATPGLLWPAPQQVSHARSNVAVEEPGHPPLQEGHIGSRPLV
mmetsp:Transcript_54178/g.161442  ORF Transcript_54178/g.161442 Transcript_54178/m.161442 type:complete len:206 (+) Transcript_54178:217-834(+)